MSRLLFASTTFVAAFLLFVVQPMLGRLLLPSLGGSPATWTLCMLFFQGGLLLGYLLAHLLGRLTSTRALPVGLLLLAAAALAFLPLQATLPPRAVLTQRPELAVLLSLTRSVGLPYVLLAAASPLLQRGYARLQGESPYPLYAVSNGGALLGLMLYPFALEKLLSLGEQTRLWSAGYLLFAVALLACAVLAARAPALPPAAPPKLDLPASLPRPGLWFGLSMVPSVMLLAVTNHLTMDVAAVPMLWVLPLALYLGSFIVAFAMPRRLPRAALSLAWLLASSASLGLLFNNGSAALWTQLIVLSCTLSLCGLLCHGRLARLAPAPRALTGYYLWIAAGGLGGGLFAGVVAPWAFRGYYELHCALLATYALLLWGGPGPAPGVRRWLQFGLGLMLPAAAGSLWLDGTDRTRAGHVVERHRDFHGVVTVTDLPRVRLLTHGHIRHGMAFRDPARASEPTFYFGRESGAGLALARHRPGVPRHIGVVGLGAGTLAAHASASDQLRMYELSPRVADLAQRHFPFLPLVADRHAVVLGDGRLSLEAEPDNHFDLLAVDVYSSNAIPVHLFTREALATYLRHLRPDGLLLFNISNRHVELERVLLDHARHYGLSLCMRETPPDRERGLVRVRWALLSREPDTLKAVLGSDACTQARGPAVAWTDDHSSLFEIIK